MRLALAIVVVAACSDPPPLTIRYALKDTGSQVCYSNLTTQSVATSCTDVSMLCAAVLDLRIVSANDPTQAYSKVCQPILGRPNLCSIAGIDVPGATMAVPEQNLAVEVAVYRDSDLAHDDAVPPNPICPTDLVFADDGTPEVSAPTPVVGGRAFYRPGDSQTVVDLSCFDQPALQDPKCINMDTTIVTATIYDFDSGVSVTQGLGDHLLVSFGEPQTVLVGPTTTEGQLSPVDVHALDRTVAGPIPVWGGALDVKLVSSACLDVVEDVAQATAAVTCKPVTAGQPQVDLPGVRVAKSTLDEILTAYKFTSFPSDGLVIGIVLDDKGAPLADVTVKASDNTNVSYLSANRAQPQGGGTSNNGIFLSTTASYGTIFTAEGATMNQPTGFGGLVQGKVDIVVLRFTQPTNP